ncbi:hypothetical protein Y032_0632g881 [Ancylostoma ceylanicum]|uniref:Uncharacterized protein n=1 Tax=Ancylostoma ceylanicum TaxID=53326 RepID=A0A016WM24_9BILA|nr:hypothetical protein Y032_0632g881 [Ancylostoma ceylanicum]
MRVEWTLRLIIALLLEPKTANLCSVETVASITELNSCFESFFTTSSSTTLEEWEVNLPNEQEEEEMRAVSCPISPMLKRSNPISAARKYLSYGQL